MSDYSFPEDLKEFLYKYIHSVGLLDVLFLLYKNPEQKWTPYSLSNELRTNVPSATNQLFFLLRNGLVRQDDNDRFYFRPESNELRDTIARLNLLYQERPVTIVTFIYEKPSQVVKGFADAFKLKK